MFDTIKLKVEFFFSYLLTKDIIYRIASVKTPPEGDRYCGVVCWWSHAPGDCTENTLLLHHFIS